jgi:hypothetical protein
MPAKTVIGIVISAEDSERMAKALVFVLVPYTVGSAHVSGHADRLLETHAIPNDRSSGWYDYLCDPGSVFDDPITEGILPNKQKRSLHKRVCDISRLPLDSLPYALVTPDGTWHASEANIHDYALVQSFRVADSAAAESWLRRYEELIAAHPRCWVVAVDAHS